MIIARNEEKNKLIKKRQGGGGVGFEDVEKAINDNRLLAIVQNKNQTDYP